MSSTSVVPDTASSSSEFRDQNWSPRRIYKAAACSSQDGNHLETRRVVPSLITGPFTQCLHWGDTTIKTVGSPPMSSGGAGPCDLPKDGKLIRVISKRSWTYTMKFFYMCRYPVGIQQQKTEKGTAPTEEITSLSMGKLTPEDICSIQLGVHICTAKSCKVQAKNHPHTTFWEWKNLSALQYRMLRITRAQVQVWCVSNQEWNIWSTQINKE